MPSSPHPTQSQMILKNINFKLDAGHSLALVGATGSGKSTIIRLVKKLYDGYEGTIRLDGEDLKSLEPQFLREQITLVPQEITSFEGSLLFNISPKIQILASNRAKRAAEMVGADQSIEQLPVSMILSLE